MKKVLVAICFIWGAVISVNAQETEDQASAREDVTTQDQEEQFTDSDKISQSDLPAMITQQLQSTDYSGWTVNEAYRKEKDGETHYKVELTNGDQKKWVKFDAQGNKIKEMDEKDKKKKDK